MKTTFSKLKIIFKIEKKLQNRKRNNQNREKVFKTVKQKFRL